MGSLSPSGGVAPQVLASAYATACVPRHPNRGALQRRIWAGKMGMKERLQDHD